MIYDLVHNYLTPLNQKTNGDGTRLVFISYQWQQVREIFGRLDLRLQDLRHSFANFLVSIGINQRDLRTILAHYKPATLALVRNNSFKNNVRAL